MPPESGAIYSSVIKEMGRLERLLDVAIGRWYHATVRAGNFNDSARLVSEHPQLVAGLGHRVPQLRSVAEVANYLEVGGELFERLPDAPAVLAFAQMLKDLTTSLEAFNNDIEALSQLYLASIIVDPDGGVIVEGGTVTEPVEEIRHVVTAWNPSGEPANEAKNRELNETLRVVLEQAGASTEPVIGKSAEGKWAEESWLVTGLDRARVAALAGEFDQIALFELEGSEVRIIKSS
jgi:hypothetical protein